LKKLFALLIPMLLITGVAYGGSVVNSKHNMIGGPGPYIPDADTDQVCVFCHTPHQTADATAQDPLWNKQVTQTATFGVYASPTLDADMSNAEIGGKGAGSQSVSALCMGCHDGTVAVNSLYRTPSDGGVGVAKKLTGYANLGTSLSDDHPINFTYDATLATKDGGLKPPVSDKRVDNVEPYLPLFEGTLQCASCHNVHDNDTYKPFLRSSINGSALCLRCHEK